jgi:hypothetical protein
MDTEIYNSIKLWAVKFSVTELTVLSAMFNIRSDNSVMESKLLDIAEEIFNNQQVDPNLIPEELLGILCTERKEFLINYYNSLLEQDKFNFMFRISELSRLFGTEEDYLQTINIGSRPSSFLKKVLNPNVLNSHKKNAMDILVKYCPCFFKYIDLSVAHKHVMCIPRMVAGYINDAVTENITLDDCQLIRLIIERLKFYNERELIDNDKEYLVSIIYSPYLQDSAKKYLIGELYKYMPEKDVVDLLL